MARCKAQLVMRYKIKLQTIAHTDLQKAKKWYREKSETLAEEFKEEVNKEIDYIGEFPEHYQIKYKALRQSLVTRFPYAIFYLVEEEKRQVVIVAVLHTSRNPKLAQRRINK